MANLYDLFAASLNDTDQSFSFNAICSSIKSIASQSLAKINHFIDGQSQGINIVMPSDGGNAIIAHVTNEDFSNLMETDEETIQVSMFSDDGSSGMTTLSEEQLASALSSSVTLNEVLLELATAISSSTSIEDLSTKLVTIKSAYVSRGDQQSARIVDSLLTFVTMDSDRQSFKSAALSWLMGLMGSTVDVSNEGDATANFGRISNFADYSTATPVVAWANSLDFYTTWPEFQEGLKKLTAPVVAALTSVAKGIVNFGYKIYSKVKDLFIDPAAYGNNSVESFNTFHGRDDFIDSFILPFNVPEMLLNVGHVDPNVKLQKMVSEQALPNIPEYASWNDICLSFEEGYIYNFDVPGAVISVQRIHTSESIYQKDFPVSEYGPVTYPEIKDYLRVALRPKALSKAIIYEGADVRGYPISLSEYLKGAFSSLSYGWTGSIVDQTMQYSDDDHIAAWGFSQASAVYSGFAYSLLGTYKQGADGSDTDSINENLLSWYIRSSLPSKAYFESNWALSCSHYDGKQTITPVDDLNILKTAYANPEDASSAGTGQLSAQPGQFIFSPSYGGWLPNANRAANEGWADNYWNMAPLVAVLVAYISKESVYFVPYTKQLSYPRGTYRLMTTEDQANMFSSFIRGSLIAAAVVAGAIAGAKLMKSLKSKVLISGAALQQYRMKFDGSPEQLKLLKKLNKTANFWNKVYGFVAGGVGFSALSNALKRFTQGKSEEVDANVLIYNAITGSVI